MKVIPLYPPPDFYGCIDYLVLGDWNKLTYVNTLIDCGGDGRLIEAISAHNTGVGKRAVEQVILTHGHFDHTSALPMLLERWRPRVYSFTPGPYTTDVMRNGQLIEAGDSSLEVMYTPLHSNDSVCLWNKAQGVLFSGDTVLRIQATGGSYPRHYVDFIDRLLGYDIRAIYSGHDKPVTERIQEMLLETMKNILVSQIYG